MIGADPAGTRLSAVRLYVGGCGNLCPGGPLFAQHLDKLLLFGPGVGVSVRLTTVVNRAAGTLREPELFGERLNVVVGQHFDPSSGMSNRDEDFRRGRQDDAFVSAQVEA